MNPLTILELRDISGAGLPRSDLSRITSRILINSTRTTSTLESKETSKKRDYAGIGSAHFNGLKKDDTILGTINSSTVFGNIEG